MNNRFISYRDFKIFSLANIYFFLFLIFGFVLYGCSETVAPNVILITVDTLRPDHLSCYGYPRRTSPNIDKIASQGILFENVVAQSSWTLPSVASILTSRFPGELRMVNSFSKFRDESLRIATILQEREFYTAAFISGGLISASRGFDKGFNTFTDIVGRAEVINSHVFKWLNQKRDKPFFLWVHYFDVHSDYDAPPPFDKRFDETFSDLKIGRTDYLLNVIKNGLKLPPAEISKIKLLYDREILYTDHHIGKLLERLRKKQVLDNSILIIGADHGEEFMEHSKMGHSFTLYDEVVKVPLIIRYPAKLSKSKKISQQVQNLDILPTILDLISVDFIDFQFRGRSLLPLIEGKLEMDQFAFSETQPLGEWLKDREEWPNNIFKSLYMIRTNKNKLIFDEKNKSWEFFDLAADSGEKFNKYSESITQDNDFKKALLAWKKSLQVKFLVNEEIEKKQSEIEKLRSLGYIN
ncbi:MAG: sulfatase [Nitrospinae bacterium]|nr:sulfatase [Nitrospinota bacterium]